MALPEKKIRVKGELLTTTGVGVNIFGFPEQDSVGIRFEGVAVPGQLTNGKELWVIVERESHKILSLPMPSIAEAKDEFRERCMKVCRKAKRPITDLLKKMKEEL